jgi:hypothetical protein
MIKRIHALIAIVFLAPIVAVLAINKDGIVEDMTPRPENGYLIYVTMDT